MNYWKIIKDTELYHEGRSLMDGAPIGSGRYRLGSGENPYHGMTFKEAKEAIRAQQKANKKDARWAKRQYNKLYNKAYRASKKEIKKYEHNDLHGVRKTLSNGEISKKYAVAYNRKLAELMSEKVSDIHSPSGKSVVFVAKRGELGVYLALTNDYNSLSEVRNGIYNNGKIAYKTKKIDMV